MKRFNFTFPLLVAGMIVVAGGCEGTQNTTMSAPAPRPLRMASLDPVYRLDAQDRGKVLPGFDVDALERLLAAVTPEARRGLLRYFQRPEKGEQPGMLVEMSDPRLQPLLEEVWAPMWDEVGATDEQLNGNHFGYPGREIARRRRAARANARGTQP
jgi:hypothetical protein